MRLIPLLPSLLLLSGCVAAQGPRLELVPVAGFPSRLAETSGLARWQQGFVSHNDSGNDADLFVLDGEGNITAQSAIAAGNRDWEDIAVRGNTLYLADTGNNGGWRRDLHILPLTAEAEHFSPQAPIPVRYAEQHNFQPPLYQHNFDAEALTWVEDELWLLTKRWLDQQTAIYKVRPTAENTSLVEQQRLNTDMLVTGADYDAKTRTLLLVGYSRNWFNRRAWLWLYPIRDGRVIEADGRRWMLGQNGQFEGIALGRDGLVYFTREGSDINLFRSLLLLESLLIDKSR
ncbi:hypothetical protein [Oceanisphaera arctica]|uniref:Phytase-like domain-containing protein n=1 Tax=Oceanisphaera arctica TaxID=641510 RepID=A0A2P5TRW0_9GAMM|nr:hypothetical protein [Oceanisphaera arctica]PPL18566.1 hypothetical protein UN63_01095 [Oceanisphaera arctica]GHA17428.1 hypothetical protein GCM10007082_17690 [Oceanisphaera arctica]